MIDQKQLLLEQYKILEARRNYFGNIFWQLPTYFIAIFAVLTGLITRDAPASGYLSLFFFINGGLFQLIAYVAHRMRTGQDECEVAIAEVEERMRREMHYRVMHLPRSRRFGARFVVVSALSVCGIFLWAGAIYFLLHRSAPVIPHIFHLP